MVTAKTQYNLANAESYFSEHLSVGDYYAEGQRVAGEWFGLGAERLGLTGRVQANQFLRLCENQLPSTGETLTQRLKRTRTENGQVVANRRIFFDFTFSTTLVRLPHSEHVSGGFRGRRCIGRAVRQVLEAP